MRYLIVYDCTFKFPKQLRWEAGIVFMVVAKLELIKRKNLVTTEGPKAFVFVNYIKEAADGFKGSQRPVN